MTKTNTKTVAFVILALLLSGMVGFASSKEEKLAIIQEQLSESREFPKLGLSLNNLSAVDQNLQTFAQRWMKLGHRPIVISVMENSPAYLAGLLPGDTILQVNGTYIPKRENAIEFVRETIEPKIRKDQEISFLVIRSNSTLSLSSNSNR